MDEYTNAINRRRQLEHDFLAELNRYVSTYNEPMQLRKLAALFGRTANKYNGGFRNFVNYLESTGIINVIYTRDGGRLIVPQGFPLRSMPWGK